MGRQFEDGVEAWAERRRFALPEGAVERLRVLCGLWLSYGRSMNLTSASSEEALLEHVEDGLDALACVRACGGSERGRWVDVGSGGGFPGLVVAAASEFRLTLVEPRQKRSAFLELAARAIESGSTGVVRCRIGDSTWNEKVVGEYIEGHKCEIVVASARAVFKPAEWLVRGMDVVRPGGIVLAHLAHDTESPQPGRACGKMVGRRGVVVGHRRPADAD